MMFEERDEVAEALCDPSRLGRLSLSQWDLLVRQARRADLLSRVASLLRHHRLEATVPVAVSAHLDAADIVCTAQHEEVRREVVHVERALASLDVPIVLLKGAAYVMAGLPAALGRTQSDVDILVPRERLPEVEAALMLAGWATTHHSAYDQRYYREWMHELPPMQHVRRRTVLDVHHAIIPQTARIRHDSRGLINGALPLRIGSRLSVLAPADMVLNTMTHLFINEELSHGLRDLSDIDLLLRHFAHEPGFWDALLDRARTLNLARLLHHGLRYAHLILATPVPAAALEAAAKAGPGRRVQAALDALWLRALRAPHASVADGWTATARLLLYVRAHWLRMPPAMLARHLAVKVLRRGQGEAKPV